MPSARFLVDNVFSAGAGGMYPSRAVSGSTEASGMEAFRVGDGRRSIGDKWAPTTFNALAWVQSLDSVPATVDMIALDRGHNLAGKSVELLGSNNDFSTSTSIFTATIPSASAAGALSAANGVLTSEGAWLKTFSAQSFQDYRFQIAAMGAGLRPNIVGLFLGQSYELPILERPIRTWGGQLQGERPPTPFGWRGGNLTVHQRAGSVRIRTDTFDETTIHFHFRDRYYLGFPMWICFNESAGHESFLAIVPEEVTGFGFARGWAYPQDEVPYEEHQPRFR